MGPVRRRVDQIMFPGCYAGYEVSTFPELKLIPATGLKHSRIPVIVVASETESNMLLIYFHGNGCDLAGLLPTMKRLCQVTGMHVLTYEYPGYGKLPGLPSESSVDLASRAVVNFVVGGTADGGLGWPVQNVVFHGSCIGCGPATRLAKNLPGLGGMVLQATMPDMNVAATNWVGGSKYLRVAAKTFVARRWRVDRDITRCACPVLWIHGKRDQQFPYRITEAMHNKYKGPKMLHLSETATHFDWNYTVDVYTPVRDFVSNMVAKQADHDFDAAGAIRNQLYDNKAPAMVKISDLIQMACLNLRPAEEPKSMFDRNKWKHEDAPLPTRVRYNKEALQQRIATWDAEVEKVMGNCATWKDDELCDLARQVLPGCTWRRSEEHLQRWLQQFSEASRKLLTSAAVSDLAFEEAVSFFERAFYLACPLAQIGLVYTIGGPDSEIKKKRPVIMGLTVSGVLLQPGVKTDYECSDISPLLQGMLAGIPGAKASQLPPGLCVIPLSVEAPWPSSRPLVEALILTDHKQTKAGSETTDICKEWIFAGAFRNGKEGLYRRSRNVFNQLLQKRNATLDETKNAANGDTRGEQPENPVVEDGPGGREQAVWAFTRRLLGPEWPGVLRRLPQEWGPPRSDDQELPASALKQLNDLQEAISGARVALQAAALCPPAPGWNLGGVGTAPLYHNTERAARLCPVLGAVRHSAAILGKHIAAHSINPSAQQAQPKLELEIAPSQALAQFSFALRSEDAELAAAETEYAQCLKCLAFSEADEDS